MASYEVTLYSPTGIPIKTVTDRITRLDWSRELGQVGGFDLSFSDYLAPIDPSLFGLNSRILIQRKAVAFDTPRLELLGFVKDWEYKTDDRGITRYHFRGPDQNDLLDSFICFPFHPYTGGFWSPSRCQYIDTFMREMVEDNLGAGSSNAAVRDVVTSNTAGLTIAVESSATATSCTTAGRIGAGNANKNLLAFLRELHNASATFKETNVGTAAVRVWFDMCLDGATALTFRTRPVRWGMNHRSDSGNHVPIGVSYGNLREPGWRLDRRREINTGYGSNPDIWWVDPWRQSAGASDAPLNRREAAAVAGNDPSAVAEAIINEGRCYPVFSGLIQDTAGCRYGVHWGLGDELSIDYLSKQYHVIVTGIKVSCSAGREKIEPTMEVQAS